MFRGMIAATALAAVISVGCEEKREGPTKEATDAADRASSQGQDALEKAKEEAQGAAKGAANTANNAGTAASEATAKQAETAKDNIEDIIAKAKDALDKNKFDEASTYVAQLESLKNQLPAEGRARVDSALAEVKRKIEEGKAKLMPAMK